MINVVCINVGTKHPDIYVNRLYMMTLRTLHQPFAFYCVTDRPRPLDPEIRQIDSSGWGVNGWFTKVKILDEAALPFDEFLFMDISMVLVGELDSLIDIGRGNDLMAMRDWHYECFGSCTMWVRKSKLVQTIWDEYARGTRYPDTCLQGDQDFINAVLKERKLEDQVRYFPQEWFVSYKQLLKLHRTAPWEAEAKFAKAHILKFHGNPRPHHLLNPWQRFRYLTLRYPTHALTDWSFLTREVREYWG